MPLTSFLHYIQSNCPFSSSSASYVTIGLNVTLNCTASGFGLTYEWDIVPCSDGCTVNGLDTPILSLGPIVFGLEGEYVCSVTDFGQTLSKIIYISPLGNYWNTCSLYKLHMYCGHNVN